MRFNIIVAMDAKRGIGNKNSLPWMIKDEMEHFKNVSSACPEDDYFKYYNAVVMGRHTWDSIPIKFRPLQNRINIVLSSQPHQNIVKNVEQNTETIFVASDWQDVFDIVNKVNKNGKFEGDVHSEPKETIENSKEEETVDISVKPIAINDIFVIGGQKVYESAINHPYCDKIMTTEIYRTYETDSIFPPLSDGRNEFILTEVSPFKSSLEKINNEEVYYRYMTYQNKSYFMEDTNIKESVVNHLDSLESVLPNTPDNNQLIHELKRKLQYNQQFQNHEENQYMDFIRDIRFNGISRSDRTGVGTLSVFGRMLKYDLRDTFPMITTRRAFAKGIFEELMMYLRGQTDNKILQAKNIHIWDGNTSREFLDNKGLQHFEEGDMGATYGFNFRHFGAEYKGCGHTYKPEDGFDQLKYAIDLIKNNPTSRRIIINLWNPATLHESALPSCLCQYQFYINIDRKELNLQIYIRSSDVFLANNWNTCTGAFLVHMICNLNGVNLKPGDLSVVVGDAHLYSNHLDGVDESLTRIPRPFPKLVIKNKKDSIEDFEWTDMEIIGYNPYPRIKVDMAV